VHYGSTHHGCDVWGESKTEHSICVRPAIGWEVGQDTSGQAAGSGRWDTEFYANFKGRKRNIYLDLRINKAGRLGRGIGPFILDVAIKRV